MENTNNKFEITVNKFNEESAGKFQKELFEASSIDASHPITIFIDSFGGYVYSLLNMMESLSQVQNPIITVCKGKAMSCGALLLAMGDQRFCGKNSSIMIHEISGGAFGNVDDIKFEADEYVRLNLELNTMLAAKMGMTYQQLKDKITAGGKRDWYLTAKEAKELGLVHTIGMPLVKPIIMYSIDVVPEKKIVIEKVQQQTKKPKKKVATKKAKTKTVSKSKKRK
jgi:ATP-dependent Clp protease protease subunit